MESESESDILERLIEEEARIRARAEGLGIHIGPEPPQRPKAPFRSREGIPSTELTERELSSLLAETRDVLDIYTIDYISEHFDEAQKLYESLKSNPISPGTLLGSRIVQNIEELKTRIDAVRERETPSKPLIEFLSDLRRVLDTVDTFDPLEGKRRYFELLKREQLLPKNVDQSLETEITELLTEIGKRIQREGKKSTEDVGEEILEEIANLIGSGRFDPEGYNKAAKRFQQVSDSLPQDLRLKIRDRIRECYAKMKSIEQRTKAEQRERETRTKKFYWDSFVAEVEQLKGELEKAQPGEFFRIYDTYSQLLDSLETADLSSVPSVQIERMKSFLDQCYLMLEDLRSRA